MIPATALSLVGRALAATTSARVLWRENYVDQSNDPMGVVITASHPTDLAAVDIPPPPKVIGPKTRYACDVATGRTPAGDGGEGIEIVGAKKDLNAKGNGPEWYRMVWRSGEWQYVSDERLPSGTYLARDRRASVSGDVFPGEIVVTHDRGKPVGGAWLIREPNEPGMSGMVGIEFKKMRSGKLAFTLPDGSVVELPNPRAK